MRLYRENAEVFEDVKVMVSSIDPIEFSLGFSLPLIQNHSVTHRHGLAVYVREGLPFT